MDSGGGSESYAVCIQGKKAQFFLLDFKVDGGLLGSVPHLMGSETPLQPTFNWGASLKPPLTTSLSSTEVFWASQTRVGGACHGHHLEQFACIP